MVLMGFKLAFAVITFRLARCSGARFWIAVLLSAVAQYAAPALQPTSSSVSVIFFALELLLIVRALRIGSVRSLFWLPILFAAWANMDVQVISGLALLLLFTLASFCELALKRFQAGVVGEYAAAVPLRLVIIVFGASGIGILCNPYTFRVFSEFAHTLYSSAGFQYFAEMKAMAFRRPQEFLLMLLVMAAYLALGRRRRAFGIFGFVFLISATLLAFRIQREAWIAVLASITVICAALSAESMQGEETFPKFMNLISAAIVGLLFFIAAIRIPTDSVLLNKITPNYPVKACDYVVTNHLPPPLFNTYSWGGFLTWYLPAYPVSIDSRIGLYGDEALGHYFDLIGGKVRLDTDPAFSTARTILLERQSGIAKALAEIPALNANYQLAYSDEVAEVFVKK